MDNFNEEEIQKKIEEKRKRFIENAHRALGFYDQNILSNSDEHKKKRSELMEKEFNKVFDEQVKLSRKYDEEPSKPMILASSKYPENSAPSPALDRSIKSIKEIKSPHLETGKKDKYTHEDSLSIAEKEMESKFKPLLASTDASVKATEAKTATPALTAKKTTEKPRDLDEEDKEFKSFERGTSDSIKTSKEKAQSFKAKNEVFSDDEEIDTNSDESYPTYHQQTRHLSSPAKNKKAKKFVVNTRHCKQERETLQYVIDLARWYETADVGEGNLIWYGISLRDCDIDVIRSRPKVYFNRYPGAELLARKKILCNIMNRMEKYFGEEFEYTPLSYMLPEEEDLLDEDMIKYKDMWYIAKPSKGRGGDGIFLVNRITDIPRWHANSELLVQHYITDPLLIDNK